MNAASQPVLHEVVPVYSNTPNLLKELATVLPNVEFHEVTDAVSDPYFKYSEILICDYDLLGPHLYDLPHTKWVQGTWAGVDQLIPQIEKDKPIPFQITRYTGANFGKKMSEYVLANIINHERHMFEINDNRQHHQWKTEGKISDYRVMSDLTIGIMGIGNLGNQIGKILHVLDANIIALGKRSVLTRTKNEDYEHISQYFTKDELPAFLKKSDYIINVLPKTQETNGILDNDELHNCEGRDTVLINIGRSNIISENSILKAINMKWIAGAILDVFDEEPLPETNPLWKNQKVFITPHVAGVCRSQDVAELFKRNLNLYLNKLPLPAVVDFNAGY